MPQEAEAYHGGCFADLARHSLVRGAWLARAAGVVVGEREGSAIVAEDSVEDLAHRDKRAIDGALRGDHCLTEPVRRIAHEDQDAFSALAAELPAGHSLDVFGRADHDRLVRVIDATAEFERGDEGGSFRQPDARLRRELLGLGHGQTPDSAVSGHERGGEARGAHPADAAA